MAEETLAELKYDGKKVIAECARRDDEGNKITSTYLSDAQIMSEEEINEAFGIVFGKTTTVKKFLSATKSATHLFYEYKGTSVDGLIKYHDTSNVISMKNMFDNCSNLTTIPLLDTSKVTNMGYMFSNCENLTTIPQLDTSNVTYMSCMFFRCSHLTTIPLLDTNSVTTMQMMFNYCSNLTTIPSLDTSNVTSMDRMFARCSSLTSIPSLDTSNVIRMSLMLSGCSNIEYIHLLNISTDLSIIDCTKMEKEAIVEVLNNLKDLTGSTSRRLTLGSTLLAKLTDDDKAIATNKNWTLG